MAKTKTKEKIVDLKPKVEKITEEQLKKVQDTVNGINRGQLEIGSMEVKKHEMMHGVAGLRDQLVVLPFRKDGWSPSYFTNPLLPSKLYLSIDALRFNNCEKSITESSSVISVVFNITYV